MADTRPQITHVHFKALCIQEDPSAAVPARVPFQAWRIKYLLLASPWRDHWVWEEHAPGDGSGYHICAKSTHLPISMAIHPSTRRIAFQFTNTLRSHVHLWPGIAGGEDNTATYALCIEEMRKALGIVLVFGVAFTLDIGMKGSPYRQLVFHGKPLAERAGIPGASGDGMVYAVPTLRNAPPPQKKE